jgi:hypothetical protein
MRFWSKAILAGVATEGAFALCLRFGEIPDLNRGDLVGMVGWLAHVPVAVLVGHLTPYQIYSDVFGAPLVLLSFVWWTGCWSFLLLLLRMRERSLQRHQIDEKRVV